ncbi:MAG: hypothetical protein RI911_812 [Candidatus Parcubacteria bacterium]
MRLFVTIGVFLSPLCAGAHGFSSGAEPTLSITLSVCAGVLAVLGSVSLSLYASSAPQSAHRIMRVPYGFTQFLLGCATVFVLTAQVYNVFEITWWAVLFPVFLLLATIVSLRDVLGQSGVMTSAVAPLFLFLLYCVEFLNTGKQSSDMLFLIVISYFFSFLTLYVLKGSSILRHEMFTQIACTAHMAARYALGYKNTQPDTSGVHSASAVALVAILVSSTLFDGYIHTAQGSLVVSVLSEYAPALMYIPALFAATVLAFLALFVGTLFLLRDDTGGIVPITELLYQYIPMYMPIAAGYTIAHNSTRLFSLAQLDTTYVWLFQVICIIVGHMCSVYIAHAISVRLFADKTKVWKSHVALTVCALIVTITSLLLL